MQRITHIFKRKKRKKQSRSTEWDAKDHVKRYYVCNAFRNHPDRTQDQWLISTRNVSSGLGIISAKELTEGTRVTIPVLWSAAGAVYGGRKTGAGESEAVSTFGAVECIRKISGPASYLNDGCSHCSNIAHFEGGNFFQDFVVTKTVAPNTELKFSYNVSGSTGETIPYALSDTPEEYKCCSV